MRLHRTHSLLLLLAAASPLFSQVTAQQQLVEISVLERNAQPAQAIAAVQLLLHTAGLTAFERGKAWNLLGLAYDDQEDLAEAQRAYEQALLCFGDDPQNIRSRAAVLDDLGQLYRQMGQLDTSKKLRLSALRIYEKSGDHAGLAVVNNNLAIIAQAQRHVAKAEDYLKRAVEEFELAGSINPDDRAAMISIQAWVAGVKGKSREAVAGYARCLALWRQSYGDMHPSVGWGRVLLADAYAHAGDNEKALAEIREGLAVLDHSLGKRNERYLTGELAYSQILDRTGVHEQAAQLRAEVEVARRQLSTSQCSGCTISVAAFR